MLALSMAFAAFWGVLQLAVLGWGTRSVRVGTSVLVMGVGFYACGVGRGRRRARLHPPVRRRSRAAAWRTPSAPRAYTVDPFVEEVVKVLPLVLAGLHLRTRRQWGLTDHLLLGAAVGAGFGLLEALMRFGHQPRSVRPTAGSCHAPAAAVRGRDHDLAAGAGGHRVHRLARRSAARRTSTSSGPPSPASASASGSACAAGCGGPARRSSSSPAPTTRRTTTTWPCATAAPWPTSLAAPFVFAQPVVWLWPVVALGVAVTLDVGVLRRARAIAPALRLRREGGGTGGARALARYAAPRPAVDRAARAALRRPPAGRALRGRGRRDRRRPAHARGGHRRPGPHGRRRPPELLEGRRPARPWLDRTRPGTPRPGRQAGEDDEGPRRRRRRSRRAASCGSSGRCCCGSCCCCRRSSTSSSARRRPAGTPGLAGAPGGVRRGCSSSRPASASCCSPGRW